MAQQIGDTRVQAAFDGRFYPQVWDGEDWEYCWDGTGEEVSFASDADAQHYLWQEARR